MSVGKDKKIEISPLYANIELFLNVKQDFIYLPLLKEIISQIQHLCSDTCDIWHNIKM